MTRHCSAGGCKSRDNRETRNAGITFHRLPKEATRRSLWIINSHRADSWDPQTDFIYFCSKHFTPESFELTGCSGIRRLREDAFPSVFDSSSTSKCKRGPTKKRDSNRKSPSSGDQEYTPQVTDQGHTSGEPTLQRSLAESEEIQPNNAASPPELPGTERLLQQEHDASVPQESRPHSPSRYMRRLPPPPGFYLSKEHSYAQICPLLWRRRYDQAIDCLEKALRQLHAARRRENRLRSTVLKLRDKRLKHTLLASQDSCKNRGSWTSGAGRRRRGKGGSSQDESETDAKCEDTGLFDDRCADQIELGSHFLPDTTSWSEEEKAFCFYCGRGQVQATHRLSKTNDTDVHPTEHEDSENQRNSETRTENIRDTKKVTPEEIAETSDSNDAHSQVLLQSSGVQHVPPAAVSLPDCQEQTLQFLGSDGCVVESDTVGQDHHLDLQQQLFWIQDSAEGQVILVPIPAVDGLQSFLKVEGVVDEAQTILVSELDLKRDQGHVTESSGGLSKAEHEGDKRTVVNSTAVERREDVREKLKEHLEGFHLQLSTEFINSSTYRFNT